MLQHDILYSIQQHPHARRENQLCGILAPLIVTVWVAVPIGRWKSEPQRRARTGGTTPQLELLDQFLWIFFGI